MLVCPSCTTSLDAELACTDCGWRTTYRDGVAVLLDNADFTDEIARSYTDNYDRIARDDLDAKVLDERYVENLAENLAKAVDLKPRASVADVGSGKGFLV